jgi:pSer/pThr/pTyr-binding forkhead associated (FHA) protein
MLGIIFLVLRILIAGLLFLFLGWSLRLIWLDLQKQARSAAVTPIPSLTLEPETDANLPGYCFIQPVVIVGRDPACDCLLAEKTISGQHARLSFQMTQWWVEDLQSTNGSFLNQQPIASPVVLTSGDELRFGQLSFRVTIEGSETTSN